MEKPLCIILMGSSSDTEHATVIAHELEKYGVNYEMRIGSAHKTPQHVLEILSRYEQMNCPKVYITIAGRSNALSGFVDGAVSVPVIACPPKSDSFGGADVFSSLRMPSGIACAVILEPKNAALFVAKMFSPLDETIRQKVTAAQKANAEKVIADDKALNG